MTPKMERDLIEQTTPYFQNPPFKTTIFIFKTTKKKKKKRNLTSSMAPCKLRRFIQILLLRAAVY